jgi:hypothetical protein
MLKLIIKHETLYLLFDRYSPRRENGYNLETKKFISTPAAIRPAPTFKWHTSPLNFKSP